MRVIDLTGQRFSRLSVVERADNDKRGQAQWRCVCQCGNISIVGSYKLRSGRTKSCGCMKKDTTHGMSRTRTYRIWNYMTQRATNPNNTRASDYVLRGIGICDEWLTFENFLADMGEAPDGMSIDRVDNNKGYCKENCRWATVAKQNRNRRPARETYPGVHLSPSGRKWEVKITVGNKPKWVGSFGAYEDAVSARKAAENLYWK